MISLPRAVHAALWCALLTLTPAVAMAGDNDVVLTRFATFDPKEFSTTTNPCVAACGAAKKDTAAFRGLTTELGEVFAPRFMSPAETLGEAGFAVNFIGSFSFIDNQKQYWKDGVEDRDPPGAFFTGHLQARKGLPFSFEVGGDLSYMPNSEMFTIGANVKWALNEGFKYLPDLALRGTVNTLLGAPDLNMIVAGGDVSISKAFGLGGTLSLTPYAGYQKLYVVASSRLLNAYPQDPRPPQFDATDQSQQFSPEFVFEQYTASLDRGFLGVRLNVWIMSFTLEGMLGTNVNQINLSGGVDF